MKVLRLNEVIEKVGLGRSSIYALMAEGQFPMNIRLHKQSVGWLNSELDEWIMAKVVERDQGTAQG